MMDRNVPFDDFGPTCVTCANYQSDHTWPFLGRADLISSLFQHIIFICKVKHREGVTANKQEEIAVRIPMFFC